MKRYSWLLAWVCVILLLVSCDQESVDYEKAYGCLTENCALVYDGFNYLTYDTKRLESSDKIDSLSNEHEYRLYNNDEYVTKGNSSTNYFKILIRVDEKLQTVYTHKNDKEAIYPFGVIDNEYIFAVMNYSGDKQKFNGLFRLNENNQLEQLETMNNNMTEKIFGVGISSDNNLYTLLAEEGEQNLYRTNLTLSEFNLIAKDVSQNLSTYHGEVCYTKEQKLFCGQKVIKELEPTVASTWIVGDKFILELYEIGDFKVTDINNDKSIASGSEFIGFEVNTSEIIIYGNGKIEKLEI